MFIYKYKLTTFWLNMNKLSIESNFTCENKKKKYKINLEINFRNNWIWKFTDIVKYNVPDNSGKNQKSVILAGHNIPLFFVHSLMKLRKFKEKENQGYNIKRIFSFLQTRFLDYLISIFFQKNRFKIKFYSIFSIKVIINSIVILNNLIGN